MQPIVHPNGRRPAHLLNYLTPPQGVSTAPASAAQDRDETSKKNQDPQGRESIDAHIEQSIDHFGTRNDSQLTRRGTEIVRQRYPDGQIQVEREMIQDDQGNYQNHGWWRLYNRAGQVIADGIFEYGLMEGPWKRLHSANEGGIFAGAPFNQFQDPFLSTATFEKGKLNGVWQIYDRSQRKIMEITYVQGKRHGPATWWYPNGTRMREMTFHHGLIDGKLIEWDANQNVVREEEFIEGRKVSIATTQFPSGKKKTQLQSLEAKLVLKDADDWWAAKPARYETEGTPYRSGPFAAWFENGQLEMQGQFFDDLREGQFVWWHSNGQKRVAGQYKKDKKDGVWIWWHANGMKAAEGRYAEDRKVGQWLEWDENGKIINREEFTADDRLPDPKELPTELPGPVTNQEVPSPKSNSDDAKDKTERLDPPLGKPIDDGELLSFEEVNPPSPLDPLSTGSNVYGEALRSSTPGQSTFRPRTSDFNQPVGPLLPPPAFAPESPASKADRPRHRPANESTDQLLQRLFQDEQR